MKKNVQFLDQTWKVMNESKELWYDVMVSKSIHLELFQNQLMSNSFRCIEDINWLKPTSFFVEKNLHEKF